eukprot:TRINITY_DN14112_c0_g1_i8.p1 TRINITY_DN14112_c0_g1~~TRINITY_DN14112_c0_g1_i8.p1  ORF type:complete len:279 (+),score=36.95 TRINITY_DN14112_c0_g1_i8:150-986(+)
MSVYSGFATRIQESSYNRAVYNMLCLLQMKIYKSYKQGKFASILEPFDDIKFSKYFARFYQKIIESDKSKHLPPKFSFALKDLAGYYGVFQQLSTEDSLSAVTPAYKFRDDSMTFIQTPRTLQSIEQSLPKFNDMSRVSIDSKDTNRLLKKNVKAIPKRQIAHHRARSLNPYLSERYKKPSPNIRKNVAVKQLNDSDIAAKPGSILFQRNIRNLSLPNTYRGRNERRLERKLVPINGSITRRRTLLIRTYSNHNNKIRFGRNRKDNRTESESAVIPRH